MKFYWVLSLALLGTGACTEKKETTQNQKSTAPQISPEATPPAQKEEDLKTVKLFTDEWCPFICDDEEKPGFQVEIIKAVLKDAGYSVNVALENWSRAIALAESGEADGIIGAAVGDAPNFLFPKNHNGYADTCAWVKADSKWKYTGVDSLKSVTLGQIQDFSHTESIDKYVEDNKKNKQRIFFLTGEVPAKRRIELILKGRYDTFLDATNIVNSTLNRYPEYKEKIKKSGCEKTSFEEGSIYFALSPHETKKQKSQAIIAAYDKHYPKLLASGEIKKIVDKYGVELPEEQWIEFQKSMESTRALSSHGVKNTEK